MTTEHYILGMAGHTDHGKSALVQVLTGVDPDRLPEEKARGMTIDLGFAHLSLPVSGNSERPLVLDIVDVPGHASFIKNMVSGVGAIDAVLFAVAADDLWMPQSEEHLQILEYLGVKQGVFALTKADLADNCEEQVAELRQWLAGSSLQDAPIVPTSTVDGSGLPELKNALANMLAKLPIQSDVGKPRLAIDRGFTRQGFGTVVTGTLQGGSLDVGQSVVVQPKKIASRVRTLQSHSVATETALPGTRSAVSLTDVVIADKGRSGVARGDVVTLASLGEPTDIVDVYLSRSDRELMQADSIKHAGNVYFHQGTDHQAAKVHLLEGDSLEGGESCLAQIRLAGPMFLFVGDRFLLRNWAKSSTLAGGIVLETHASRRHYRSQQRIALLIKKHAAINCLRDLLLIELTQNYAMVADQVLKQSNYSDAEIADTIKDLKQTGDLLSLKQFLLDPLWWEDLLSQAEKLIDAEHQANPQLHGISLSTLRSSFETKMPIAGLFDCMLDSLLAHGFHQSGNSIGRMTHQATLPAELRIASERICIALRENMLNPPSCQELIVDSPSRKALDYLILQGEVIKINEALLLYAEVYRQAKDSIRNYLQEHGSATLAQIRDLLGSTRKVVVPLVEKLDQEGFTVRSGDLRKLK